jgi:hypothetical protein
MKQTTQTTFNFPIAKKRIIVETDLMREMESRVLAIHELCGFCVWYGSSGAGKTTSAEWMTRRINTAFNENDENSFKAVNYEVGKIRAGWGNEAKRAIRTLYSAIASANLDEGLYGRRPVEELADMVVYAAQKNSIQMVFVDESGLLSPSLYAHSQEKNGQTNPFCFLQFQLFRQFLNLHSNYRMRFLS